MKFKVVVLASCGLIAAAMALTPGRPNYLEGGHTYFYSTTAANTPANADNIFGRQPQKLENYAPTLGRTNMIFMARSDTFSISTDYQFRGIVSYTGSIITSQGTSSNLLEWNTPVDGVMTFKISDSSDVRNSGGGAGVATTYTGGGPVNLYFTHANSDAKTLVQVCCINRSDAYYRVPINDIYYVPTGASLWFRSLDNQLGSPWEAGVSGKWSWTRDAKFDKFTISAAAGETVHLRSQDGVRDLTVHVIDPATFHFESRLVYFRGTETRTLSSILWEKNLSCTTADVVQVTSAAPAEVSVAAQANGDWKLQAHGHYDLAREVTVTLANGDVVLLKIVSTPGRFEDAMCASTLPPTLLTTCTSLLVNDAGAAVQEPEWETSSSTNAPPGYTNVMQTLNCVRFNGRRYSAFVACKTPDFTTKFYNNEAIPAGQLRVVKTLLKVVCWLEDENGDLFVNPKVCFGGIAFGDRNPTRFSLGVPGRIYTDDSGLKCEAYLGATLSALNLSQGVAPDEYGYYTVMVCCQGGIRDELAVFSLSNCHKLEVRKELQGADDGSRYLFEVTYTDLDDTVVTKRFSLANGEKHSFAVKDGGIARVREVAPSDYVASLRVDETGDFAYGSNQEFATMTADHVVEFRNQRVADFDPVGFWFTDHEDAGPGLVNLAFQPTFAYANLDVAQWLKAQQAKNGIRLAVATSQTELRTATSQAVVYRDGTGTQDIDKGWVWITTPTPEVTSATTNVGFYTQLTVDKQMVGYNAYLDNIIGTSADSNSVTRTDIAGVASGDSGKTIYSFSNPSETEQVMVKRKSRVKSVLLVGGGGAGGGGTGGGGGGGEVKLIDGSEFGFLNVGDVFHVKVGRGGAPAGTVWGNSHGTYPNGVSNFPGSDGGASVLEIGGKTFTALGGGGGGSSHSTYEGATTPIGLGRSGANGGGSAGYGGVSPVSPTGGVARAAQGNVGGGASSTTSGNGGAGGGGGMGSRGVSGTASASGDGGAGVVIDLPGMGSQVYGAGGGGGANSAVSSGQGGVNAGNGGGYVYSTAAATPGGVGSDAVAGFGGGGGGGGRWGSVAWNQYLEYRGGRGGDGRVVVVLQDASVADADCVAEQIALETAVLKATVLSDELRRGLDISCAYAPQGAAMPSPTPVRNDVKEGESVTVPLTGLTRGTTYDFEFTFVDDAGRQLKLRESFTTRSVDFKIGYEDANLIVSSNVMTNDPQRSVGDYWLVANRACTNGHVLLKRELVFLQGLVVGGGGAGGVMVGGGGGGGGVTNVTDIFKVPAGTDLLVDVGAGGLALKKASKEFNDPGDASSLTIDARVFSALGGGVGASRYTAAGGNGVAGGTGANGGGGVGETGAGGTSSDGSGFAGGKGANRWNSGTASIAGGGGGAGEKGADGEKGTSNTTNFAGKGGEGVVSDFTGTDVVYGSGGGGGADQYVQPGAGGTNGGAGGAYQKNGEPGVDGTGGGGGGCGYSASPSTTLAGRGGCGAVMFQLQRPENGMVVVPRVNVTSPFTAVPALTVAMLDAGMSGVAVDFAYVQSGGTFPAWTRIAENVQEGTTVPVPLTDLAHTWTYEYKFRLVGSQGERIVGGEFSTPSLGFDIGYEDGNIIISSGVMTTNPQLREGGELLEGDYLLVASNACSNAKVILKRAMTLYGGGIEGTASVTVNGAALDLARMTTLPAGTELMFTVGTGSVKLNLATSAAQLAAAVAVGTVTSVSAQLMLNVATLDGNAATRATVSVARAKGAEEFGAWTTLATDVASGQVVTNVIPGLLSSTDYRVKYKLALANGTERVVEGAFRTAALGFATCFEDDNLIVSAEIGVKSLLRANGSEYCIFASGCYTNVRVIVKNDLILNNAVIVGGGGAGGSTLGGGGGGGGVLDIVSDVEQQSALAVAAGTELVFTIGAGGKVGNENESSRNGDGGATTLGIGTASYTANGGGAGASQNLNDGFPGGNGGGASNASGKGGEATTIGGHAGGAGAGTKTAAGGTGGGGGAAEDGGNATIVGNRGKSGKGGEGRSFTLAGETFVFGSGGGGGANGYSDPGLGGTHAGAGGSYGKPGGTADAGYGGGGGGAGNSWQLGGNGGSGAVLLRLMRSEKGIGATAKVNGVGPFAAEPTLSVSILEDGVTAVAVDFAWAVQGETLPAWTRLADQVLAGGHVATNLTALTHSTTYQYQFRVTGSQGERIIGGTFTTSGLGFTVGYEDKNVIASEAIATANPQRSAGDYRFVVTNACTDAKLYLKRTMTFHGALLVGGGGAGGGFTGAGGGGGGVKDVGELVQLPAWSEIVLTVGAGGAAPDISAGQKANAAGGETRLTVGGQTYVALGGGVGAARAGSANTTVRAQSSAGGSGANGGGGMGSTGVGGTALDSAGHAGGAGARRADADVALGGGGGGAYAAGGAAQKGVGSTAKPNSAGAGGEGVPRWTGNAVGVFGSGGGGGGDEKSEAASGGTNAGAGGAYQASGTAGNDGFGGGGGGAGYDNGKTYAGRGGDGAVMLGLAADEARMVGSVNVASVEVFTARLKLNVAALDGNAATRCRVERAVAKSADANAAFANWVTVANDVASGTAVADELEGLDSGSVYQVRYRLSGTGLTTTEVVGAFRTRALGFGIGYEDGNLIVSEGVMATSPLQATGEYRVVAANACADAKVILKRTMTLYGGSIAGVASVICNGVALDLSQLATLPAGTELVFTVGAGSATLNLAPAEAQLAAAVVVKDVSPVSGRTILNVATLDGNAATRATVSVAFARGNDAYGDWTTVTSELAAGASVTNVFTRLSSDTDYRVKYRVAIEGGAERVVEGSFHTTALGFEVLYEDDNLIVPAAIGANGLLTHANGEYGIYAGGCYTNMRVIVKSDLVLNLGLVVAGGGAGGPTIGGGGGGGGVLDVVADVEGRLGLPLAAGTELVFTTGAGGRSLGQNQSTRNENGQDSTLTIGATTYTAEGGGAGGGQSVNSGNGFAGGNGGGAAKSPGVGGAATMPSGFAGGAGGVHGSVVTSTGGGGGAAAPGGNARTLGSVFAAGNGGEGRLVRVGGQTFVFGSGGGGGSDGTTTVGAGGTHAGSGGVSGKPGGAGDAGFGGGGGGAGTSWQLGGNGGSGAVLFQLFTPAAFATLTNQPPQVVISEVMASNGETIASGDGTEGLDWVELRNDSPFAVDLTDWKLSDETGEDGSGGEKLKGARMLPAFGTIIVWADKDKAKAKDFLESETYVKLGLSTDGEDLSLIAPGGTVVSTLSFGKQVKDYSYGRDAQGNLGHYRVPTPGAYNTGTMYGPVTPRVQFSVPHGYQSGPISVALTCAQANGREIRYTTDGSSPTTNSTLYTAPIAISRTTCLRAAVMEPNSVLQDDTSATYLYLDDIVTSSTATPANFPASGSVNSHTMMYGMPNLPAAGSEDETRLYRGFTNGIATLSFVIDPKDLFDSKTGIYVNCSLLYKGDEWERKVMVEQIDPRDATNEFAEPAGLRLRGASSSRVSGNPKHSFHLYFRSRYGAGSLKFPLFGEEGADEFDTVDLRTDQNYSWSMPSLQGSGAQCTFIHEVFARDTQRDMGTYYTRSRYYHLYINGQYWGLYQTQERGNSSFAKTYNGGKKANYDVIKTTNLSGSYVVEADSGDWNAWSNLWYIACKQGFSGTYSNNYEKVRGLNPDGTRNPDYPVLLNQENLMAYVMNSHYMCDGDSPVSAWLGFPNNMYCLRNRVDGDDQKRAGFFFLRHDAEHAMGGPKCTHYRQSYGTYTKDPTGWGTGSSFATLKQFNPFELHYTLCDHPEYKLAFADAFYRHCLRAGGALTVEQASERFRKRMTELDDAIVCEAARWARSGSANGQKRANWLTYCGYGFEFITNRLSYMTTQYRGKGWYPQTDAPVITDANNVALADGQELAYGAQAKITVSGTGTVAYYTLDGTDPRAVGGAIAENATAVPANGLVTLPTGRVTLKVRARSSGGEWSALAWVEVLVASPNNQLVVANLRVAEVMSAPAGDNDANEYIVLTNLSTEASLDLQGVRMRCYKPKKSDDVDITFPAGTQIAAGGSLRLEQAMWWAASKLKNKDIEIKLVNAVGDAVQTAGVNAETWFATFDPPLPCDGKGFAFRALEFGASVTTEAQWEPGK